MNEHQISADQLRAFAARLRQAERSPGTVENYLRHARAFAAWLGDKPVTKEAAASACRPPRSRTAGPPAAARAPRA